MGAAVFILMGTATHAVSSQDHEPVHWQDVYVWSAQDSTEKGGKTVGHGWLQCGMYNRGLPSATDLWRISDPETTLHNR
jgi:hypothetical protein